MSPDSQEPKGTWQGPSLHWEGQPNEVTPPLSYEQDEAEEVNSDQLIVSAGEDRGTGDLQDSSLRFEQLKKFGQQISPFITPLLFGGITFLFLQPLMRSGQFYLHADRLWPVGLVIIAAMILQGTMLYYAGTNNAYWTLGIVGGFFLFLLVGCFTLFGPAPTLGLLIVLLIASIVAARFATHPVVEGSVDIIYSFGKYSRTLFPGLNFMLPWEKVTAHLQTKERTWICPEQAAPIAPNEDAHLKAMISYQLMPEDAHLAVLQVEKWEESLQELFKTILQSTVAHLTPDDFLTWSDRFRLHQSSAGGLMLNNPDKENAAHWGHINLLLTQQMQDHVAPWGVQMNWVHIRDITLTPRAIAPVVTDANILMRAAAATTPPVQGQAQPSPMNMASSTAGRATVPPVMGNRVPPVVNKPAAEPRPAAAARTKPPSEEVLKNAYKQIQNGSITSPEAIRSIAAGFQAIADDPEANKNASFDAALAAQTLYERANLYEAQASAASPVTPPVSASKAYREDVPTQSGWSYRTSSDDNMLAGG